MECGNAFALPPEHFNHGPLTRGPSNCQPSLPRGASHGHLHGPAWPPATCPRPMRLAWAICGRATWPHCQVASALVVCAMSAPRATSAYVPHQYKFNKNQFKIRKRAKTSEIYNFKYTTPFYIKFSSSVLNFFSF